MIQYKQLLQYCYCAELKGFKPWWEIRDGCHGKGSFVNMLSKDHTKVQSKWCWYCRDAMVFAFLWTHTFVFWTNTLGIFGVHEYLPVPTSTAWVWVFGSFISWVRCSMHCVVGYMIHAEVAAVSQVTINLEHAVGNYNHTNLSNSHASICQYWRQRHSEWKSKHGSFITACWYIQWRFCLLFQQGHTSVNVSTGTNLAC